MKEFTKQEIEMRLANIKDAITVIFSAQKLSVGPGYVDTAIKTIEDNANKIGELLEEG